MQRLDKCQFYELVQTPRFSWFPLECPELHHSRKLLRNPCVYSPTPIRFISILSALIDSGFSFTANKYVELFRRSSMSSSIRSVRGTRCSRFAFMRDAGTVHMRVSLSISPYVARRASDCRQAVSITNSNNRADRPSRWRKRATKAGTFDRALRVGAVLFVFCWDRAIGDSDDFSSERIRLIEQALDSRSIENLFDALSNAGRCLWFRSPDRIEYFEDERSINLVNSERSNH